MSEKDSSFRKWAGKLFGLLMIVVYCGMGLLLAATPFFRDTFPTAVRLAAGFLLLAYGVFRGYRLFKQKGYD